MLQERSWYYSPVLERLEVQRLEEKAVTCKDCICSEVCYYKSFNDVRSLQKRRNDVEKICKSFVHRDRLNNDPTVDAVEVVHGRWEKDEPDKCGNRKPRCSVCGKYHLAWWSDYTHCNYCPNCGAKMDGERKDNER
jgi:hypothetical protein